MSGGHWHYTGSAMHDTLHQIGTDPEVMKRWPKVSKIFTSLSVSLKEVEHDMDWALSGDTEIENDELFDLKSSSKILKGLANWGKEIEE